jgi:uncharacterized protein (TIGR02118 family)
MVKVVGLVKKRADMTREEFKDYWLNKHSRLEKASLKVNPVRRIVANFFEENLIDRAPFDGMVELYFDDIDQMRAQWSSGHDETMKNDEANFCDPSYRIFFVVEEVEIGRR